MTDWAQVCFRASELPTTSAVALTRRLRANPEDIEARVELIGLYYLRLNRRDQTRRAEQLLWLALHHPEIRLGGFGYVEEEYAPELHRRICAAWRAAAKSDDLRVLENAGAFLGFNRPKQAEAIYRKAAELQPKDAQWRERIARTFLKRARWAGTAKARRGYALSALGELAHALKLTKTDESALQVRIDLAEAATLAERWAVVRKVAPRMLSLLRSSLAASAKQSLGISRGADGSGRCIAVG